jgi:hypothetical protein
MDVKRPFELSDIWGDPPVAATTHSLTIEVISSSCAPRRLFRRELEKEYSALIKDAEGIIYNADKSR